MSKSARVLLVATTCALVVGVASPAAAHGIGGRADLPVPLGYFLIGAGIVLVVSFIALAALWKTPRFQDGPVSRSIGVTVGRRSAAVFSVLGSSMLLLVIAAGLFGVQNGTRNLAPVMVWVVFWLVVPFAGALVGNVYADLNPWRGLSSVLMAGGDERTELLSRWGVLPAGAAFFAFTWLELVWPDSSSPRTLAVAALVYTLYVLAMAAWAGPVTGLQVGEAFTTYNRLLSAISPLGRSGDGRVVWRGWLRALSVVPRWRGLTVFVILMIGTVSYDGLSGTSWWRDLLGRASGEIWAETLGMVVISGLIGAAYWGASWAAVALTGESGLRAAAVAASFAHTLVPIALAYAVAHYFTLVLFEGQLLLSTLSDPFGRGWDLFGTAGRDIQYWLSVEAVWYVQLVVILAGHVAGVVLAHDRALVEFSEKTAVRSQYAMLVLMVLLTSLGLTILAAG